MRVSKWSAERPKMTIRVGEYAKILLEMETESCRRPQKEKISGEIVKAVLKTKGWYTNFNEHCR